MLFEDLKLNKIIKENLKNLNYIFTTKIQDEIIKKISQKKDIIAQSKTGSGKTAAFCLPIIDNLLKSKKELNINSPKVLILAPSRELCSQIGNDINKFAKNTQIKTNILHGGEDFKKQEVKIKNKKYDILISTPTRIYDLVRNNLVKLNDIKFFILDEADKIIEESFNSNLKYLNKKLPKKNCQKFFFSATITKFLENTSKLILKDPIKIKILETFKISKIENKNFDINLNLIKQNILFVQKENKYKLLLDLLKKKDVKTSIIFTNSKSTVDELVNFLRNNEIFSQAIHSGKSNVHRNKVITNLKTKKNNLLIATDLAARGLDIPNISHIFNFDIPTSYKIYLHRIGRCGRAGKLGVSFSFCSSSERNFIKKIEEKLNFKLNILTHNYHSEFAKKALGSDAKPKFKSKSNNFGKHKKKPKFQPRILKNQK